MVSSIDRQSAAPLRMESFFSNRWHSMCVKKGKGSPYSTAERRVPQLIPVLDSRPAGDVSHKPGGRLPLLSATPAVTPATLKRAATRGKSGPALGGTEYRLMPSACRLIVRAKL